MNDVCWRRDGRHALHDRAHRRHQRAHSAHAPTTTTTTTSSSRNRSITARAASVLILLMLFTTDMLALLNKHFFVSLTVADLCVGLFVTPFSVWTSVFERWTHQPHTIAVMLTSTRASRPRSELRTGLSRPRTGPGTNLPLINLADR